MEIKILVPENRESDLDNFIKDCESKGFELQNRGGGIMPNFSGYYATLKGPYWKNSTLEAENKELRELLIKAKRTIGNLKRSMLVHPDCEEGSEFDDYTTHAQEREDEIEALLQRIKPSLST